MTRQLSTPVPGEGGVAGNKLGRVLWTKRYNSEHGGNSERDSWKDILYQGNSGAIKYPSNVNIAAADETLVRSLAFAASVLQRAIASSSIIQRAIANPFSVDGSHLEHGDFFDSSGSGSSSVYGPSVGPAFGCLRDEERIQIEGRVCLKKCTSDDDCIAKKKKCICDGACGKSCVNPVNCGPPPYIPNAAHNASSMVAYHNFNVNSTVSYFCLPGFNPVGTVSFPEAKCILSDDTLRWYGPDFTCAPRKCELPWEVLNGRRLGDCLEYRCAVEYECQLGFEIRNGPTTRVCRADGAWEPEFSPICEQKTCPLPDPIANGTYRLEGPMIEALPNMGAKAFYECDEGLYLTGPQQRTCQAVGNWSSVEPSCEEKMNCGPPPYIPNAAHNASSMVAYHNFNVNSTVSYFCLPGFNPVGTVSFPEAKCILSDDTLRWYGPDFTCAPRKCELPWEVLNGRRLGDCLEYRCAVEYECQLGFEIRNGPTTRVCRADGAWEPEFSPICEQYLKYLQPVELKEHLKALRFPLFCVKPTPRGIRFDSSNVYKFLQIRKVEGNIRGSLASAVLCPTPKEPHHGRAIFTALSYNSLLRYECDYGYMLRGGNRSRSCQADRSWSGSAPTCQVVSCGSPGLLYNGYIEGYEMNVDARIIFHCLEGMLYVGHWERDARCLPSGRWSQALPECL
ncbi:unnamed protein product, partial [Cyprideis torosa]